MILAHILSFGQWWLEAPREFAIALFMWFFGFFVGIVLARKHITKPAELRHEEQMEAHNKTHKNLGIK